MTNPLDPVWEAYEAAKNALKVVRRCVTIPSIDADRPLRNTLFHHPQRDECVRRLEKARTELDDLAVLSLAATFERNVRDRVIDAGARLSEARPIDVGAALARLFESESEFWRVEDIVKVFESVVGDAGVSDAMMIRRYRDWVAHGRNPKKPPGSRVTPKLAFDRLSDFLTKLQP